MIKTSDCSNDSYACASGVDCIPWSSVCDGNLDCVDLSDELGCGECITARSEVRPVLVLILVVTIRGSKLQLPDRCCRFKSVNSCFEFSLKNE